MMFSRIVSKLQQLIKPEFAAGAHAERLFEALCSERGHLCERIAQDEKSFLAYARLTRYGKRGDYLIRRFNVEIEVKCSTTYGKDQYHYLKYAHVQRHLKMQEHTNTRVIFAFFEREGRRAAKDSLRMIPLQDLVNRKPRIV